MVPNRTRSTVRLETENTGRVRGLNAALPAVGSKLY